jgi:hypothetical protein
MKECAPAFNLVNRAMELIHPQLFSSTSTVREKLRELPSTKELATQWQSVFTAISVIANRRSKRHRDFGGNEAWYDFLITLGNYSQDTLRFEELGLELLYGPGTAVAFCANVFKHETGDWGRGDRVCYAFFNKEVVLKRFGQEKAGWMTLDDLSDTITK